MTHGVIQESRGSDEDYMRSMRKVDRWMEANEEAARCLLKSLSDFGGSSFGKL